jgi:mutual gliding-motility protein MglA
MFINWKMRELNLKIVYYGPAMSGKTSTLECIYAKTNPQVRGDLVMLKTREDRTIFFDFLQLTLGTIKGLTPKFNLYTVPGQVCYAATRKLTLQGADGVVFVADSQMARLADNIQSYRMLHQQLRELNMDPSQVPYVAQYNKRDMPKAAPLSLLDRYFRADAMPSFETVATDGIGVLEALKAAISLVVTRAQKSL